jgi:hypothetical protein
MPVILTNNRSITVPVGFGSLILQKHGLSSLAILRLLSQIPLIFLFRFDVGKHILYIKRGNVALPPFSAMLSENAILASALFFAEVSNYLCGF